MEVAEKARAISNDVYGMAKPKLRGAVHAWAIVPLALGGLILSALASTAQARAGAIVYAISATGMLAASAAYHRLKVSDGTRSWLRKVDHSMIGVCVAGTYTPVVLLTIDGTAQWTLLAVLWAGALGGLVLTVGWTHAPRWVRAGLYVCLGWAGVAIVPSLLREAGVAALVLVVAGGVFYSLGAVVYGRRKPNPSPQYFGFHEVFHTFVVIAVACHFAAVAVVIGQTTGIS